jgi:hypothetical protein
MATAPATVRSDPSDRSRHAPGLLAYASVVLATAATAGWVIAVLLMTTRGFDITDEGFYVLSYRWWSSNLHTFNGAQYLYGPVFDALGHNVAALRVFRLVSVLGVAALFATAFMNWLAVDEPRVRPLRWRVAGIAAIVASAGLIYGWLPHTPGYDDVAALGGLATAAIMLSTARRWQVQHRYPLWLPLAGGALCTLQTLAKWSSLLNVAVYAAAVLLVFLGSGRRTLLRYAALVLAGAGATALLIQLFVVRLDQALPEMWFVNQAALDESASPVTRTLGYLGDVADLGAHAVRVGYPVILLALASRLAPSRRLSPAWAVAAVVAVVVAFGLFWVDAVDRHAWQGGPARVGTYSAAVLALVVASMLSGARLGRPSARRLGPLLMLAAIPLTQAFGTDNTIWMVAGNAFAAWFALVIWCVATRPVRPAAGLITQLGAASIVILVSLVASTGMLAHPYRTAAYSQDTASVPGLTSVRIPPNLARQYTALRRSLRPYLADGPAPILALDRMPGLVFIVGGTAAGEPWNGTRLRSGAILRRACDHGEVGPDNPPIVLLNRTVAQPDVDALRACGFAFPGDFTEIVVRRGPPGVHVFVPR